MKEKWRKREKEGEEKEEEEEEERDWANINSSRHLILEHVPFTVTGAGLRKPKLH